MAMNPWLLAGWLLFSVILTLATGWLVAWRLRPEEPRDMTPGTLVADLIWAFLLWASAVVAVRYIERIHEVQPGQARHTVAFGYVAFTLSAILVSLLRAYLFQQSSIQRSRERREAIRQRLSSGEMLDLGIHNLTYLLPAIVVYLTLAFLLRRPADPLLLIPVCIGALLPDLDSQTSLPGRLLPSISSLLETRLGHLGPWHTLPAAALVGALAAALIPLIGIEAWYLLPIGFLSHLLLDLFRQDGVMALWPVSQKRYRLFGGPIKAQGGPAEKWLAGALAIAAMVLLPMVDARKPLPAPSPSFEQTLDQYYRLRGRNLVFAGVQGTWQATGRRIGARFEILNAAGESFVMLDRFTGTIFTAGRDATDNFYINQINLQPGPEAEIKAVELHLEDEPLLSALPTIYQMQHEPSLQHIFVSGDLVVPASQNLTEPTLSIDYAQTSLRKIQSPEPGHYTLRYLTAAELIALASLRVESAELLIVATSADSGDRATPTPLPSPPPITVGPP
jgi:membrane-bound metal-dependent hydrolase YbcI (DUF457 family)